MESYISSAVKQFAYYKHLADSTIDRLTLYELQQELVQNSNSIAIIMKHMAGNMLSRWTNFLTEDGEKTWRNRDDEFVDTFDNNETLHTHWNDGWTCLFDALATISDSDLKRIVFIRNQGHTVVEAINRQLSHYAYHVGQIVFLGKLIKGEDWSSLSIPKGDSANYNQEKFNKEKGRRHFTDDV